MDVNFAACLDVILGFEAGFVDNPDDPGGATNLGVTLDTWSHWIGRTATIAEIEALTKADVTPVYQSEYWNVAHCGDWPSGVDLIIFDSAVNQGPGRAIRTLQGAAGVSADGLVGPATLAAVKAASPAVLIKAISAARLAQYQSLSTYSKFGRGWTNRLNAVKAKALEMVT